ncbi:MAG: replication initiator protein A [Ruminococcus sp.]|nr:replication initiator protein A [Ruminococcus sp.]
MKYDYLYNQEALQYAYYQMPKNLFDDEPLQCLSVNARFLYTLLLAQAKLSLANGWLDNDGRVYVYFAQAKLMEILNCGRTKISAYFKELDENGGVGLIERIHHGNKQNDTIFVKNFARPLIDGEMQDLRKQPEGFEYFTASNFSHFRFRHYVVPKMLFDDERIKGISNRAKMLYCFLLDKMSLSEKYGYIDDKGRLYVKIDRNGEEIKKFLNCSSKTVERCLGELRTDKGVGLIKIEFEGKDNLSRIYLLDFSTFSKYKNRSISSNVFDENIATDKNEHHFEETQSDVNIATDKYEHRYGQMRTPLQTNMNITTDKCEHPYISNTNFSNTDLNNTDFSNPSINQTAEEKNFSSTSEKIDGLMDKKSGKQSFLEILSQINSHYAKYHDDIEDESYFDDYDESERATHKCSIPYSLSTDKNGMKQAVKFLFAYSCRVKEMEKTDKQFLDSVIKALTELMTQDMSKAGGRYVKYHQIIDIINDIVKNSSLMDWYNESNGFKEHWENILARKAENGEKIPYPYAFMKSCMANFLLDYNVHGTMDEMAANGTFRTVGKKPDNSNGFVSSKYDICINNFDDNNNSDGFNADEYEQFLNNFPETEKSPVTDTEIKSEDNNMSCRSDCQSDYQTESTQPEEMTFPVDDDVQKRIDEFMAKLRGKTEGERKAEQLQEERNRQARINSALAYKRLYEEAGEPVPDDIMEILAENNLQTEVKNE